MYAVTVTPGPVEPPGADTIAPVRPVVYTAPSGQAYVIRVDAGAMKT